MKQPRWTGTIPGFTIFRALLSSSSTAAQPPSACSMRDRVPARCRARRPAVGATGCGVTPPRSSPGLLCRLSDILLSGRGFRGTPPLSRGCAQRVPTLSPRPPRAVLMTRGRDTLMAREHDTRRRPRARRRQRLPSLLRRPGEQASGRARNDAAPQGKDQDGTEDGPLQRPE